MEEIKKETLLKLIELSDINHIQSPGDMCENMQGMTELLEKDFADIYADYLLED